MRFPSEGLRTKRLHLRPARFSDAPALLDYQLRNRDYLQPWEPLREEHFYLLESMQQRLSDMEKHMQAGNSLHLLLFRPDEGGILGECNFTQIMRGPFNACYLGFSLDQHAQGCGFMHEALHAAIEYMFTQEKLHRIMASYRPENMRSEALLLRLGFEQEGRARSYLKINGRWADHVLTARINDHLE